MKRLPILALTLLLCACDPYVKSTAVNVQLPEGLKDCKFYTVKPNSASLDLNIVRCPSSDTSVTYKSGKMTINTATIESEAAAREARRSALIQSGLDKLTKEEREALGL